MSSYWDHSEQERAALSDEQMTALEKFELMEAGIVIPAAPEYEEIIEVTIPKVTLFKISYNGKYSQTDLAAHFDTAEQAQKVAELLLDAFVIDTDYKTGANVKKQITDITVGTMQVADGIAVTKSHALLVENKDKKERNSTLRNEYGTAQKKQAETLSNMRNDRYEQLGVLRRCQKMQAIWEDYLETCGGDETTAMKFFQKAYNDEAIKEMNEWLGGENEDA